MSVKLLRKIIGSNIEISQEHLRKLCDSALGEYDLLKEVLDRQDEGHIVLSKEDHEVLLITRNLTKLIPVSTSGKSFSDSIKDPDLKKYFKSVLDGNESMNERDFSFGEGEIKTIRISFLPFMLNDVEYIDIRFNDITDALKKEMKLRNTEALASMTTMAAGVAHEIKNPLAAMQIYTSLLRKAIASGKGMEKANEFIDIIEQETERLNEIAVDFLFAVKPMQVDLKLDSLNEIIMELGDFVAVEAVTKNIKMTFHLDKFIPSLMLDRKLLRRAFLNVINNSFYAMKTGGELIIEDKCDGDYVKLSIIDNGTGMSEETKKRIFEPYYTTKAESGTGLGLTAVLKIVNAHSAEITLDSQLGVGTCFTFKFPIPKSQRKVLKEKE
ncbi:MAG TPA: hypothetical protein IAA76_09420 [Candidatus Ornithospirochaeta stercorigallinarum]|nr:hypothetical protein [Candidatus Ornithospirochaeta stercorigallinarum]